MSWTEKYASKLTSAEQAAKLVKPGNRVFVGTGCATPLSLVGALERTSPTPDDVDLNHFLTTGLADLWADQPTRYRHTCFFVGSDMRDLVKRGAAAYIPISLAQVPTLIENGRFQTDVAMIQVSRPDANGFVSLGISVDIGLCAAQHSKIVLAEVNRQMPRTHGETWLHVNQITALIEVDRPLGEYQHSPIDDIARRIAIYVAEIIEDGATLHVDLGRITNETLRHLNSRRDLAIHSNVLTDPMADLIRQGVVTGRHNVIHPGKVFASFAIGSRSLYDLMDDNPLFAMYPINVVADPGSIARQPRMVSLSQAFAIDLTGQVCADQFEGEFYSGVSTQADFHRGAAMSRGGKPIVCLRSTTDDGTRSRIRSSLLEGEGVTLARSDVHYVVTEYGIAHLFGKSIRDRAISLIEIAHPDFREGLLADSQRLGIIPRAHRMVNRHAYAVEEERTVSLRDGQAVMLRPARSGDVGAMQRMFHLMSSQDVYMRFFRKLRALSYDEAQRLCNVDFESDVAFVAILGDRETEEIIGTGAYFLNPSTNMAEVAFMVLPHWQGSGLGSAIQQRLKEFAVARRVRGFIAEVLQSNTGMIALAKRLGPSELHYDEDMVKVVTCFE
jgi:acyl-CoA hydrolase/RimJ/RimL family protein N-acetyltransferase